MKPCEVEMCSITDSILMDLVDNDSEEYGKLQNNII